MYRPIVAAIYQWDDRQVATLSILLPKGLTRDEMIARTKSASIKAFKKISPYSPMPVDIPVDSHIDEKEW